MRKFLLGLALLALLAPAIASAQTLPQRQQSGYDTGYIVNCIGLDGVTQARCLVPSHIMVDATGVPLGTVGNPIYTSSAGGGTPTGTAGNPNPAVVTVQGISNGTVLPINGAVTANIGTTNGLALDTSVNSLFKSGQNIGNSAFALNAGTASIGTVGLNAGTNAIGSITNTGFASTDSRPPIPNLYIAIVAGTGYAVGDILDKIVVSQASTGAFINSYWINRTQGTSIAAPTAGTFVAYFATQANQQTQITTETTIAANQTNGTQVANVQGNIADAAATGGISGVKYLPIGGYFNPFTPSYNNNAGAIARFDKNGMLLIRVGQPGQTITGSIANLVSFGGVQAADTVVPATSSWLLNPAGSLVQQPGDTAGTYVVAKGSATLATGQVSVGTTATLIREADTGRTSITVIVGAANACAFGNSGVTLTTGYLLPATPGATDTTATSAALYGVCSAATTVSYKAILP